MNRLAILSAAALIASSTVLAADAPADAQAQGQALLRFVGDTTVSVTVLNIARLDAEELGKALLGPTWEEIKRDASVQRGVEESRQWRDKFVKAGGEKLYLFWGLDKPEKALIVVPLKKGSDADALGEMIRLQMAGHNKQSKVMGEFVVVGSSEQIAQLEANKPAPRPEFLSAFAAVGDAAIGQMVFVNSDFRRALEDTYTDLPAPLGGGPSTVLTRGILWGAAAVNVSPKLSLSVTIQSQSPQAAADFGGWIEKLLKLAAVNPELRNHIPGLQDLLAALQPTVSGDRLALSMNDKQLQDLCMKVAGPSLFRAREQAKRAIVAANVRGIVMGCNVYAGDNKGRWPADLRALVDAKYTSEKILQNPRLPGKPVGYVYIPPPADAKPDDTLVIYEAYDNFGDGINVGFLDGHVEFIADEARFKKLLDSAKAQSATSQATTKPTAATKPAQ